MPETEQRQGVEKPEQGQRFTDPFSADGYGWRVVSVEHGIVHLRGTFEGEDTEANFHWAVDRWHMLFERGMLA